MGRFLLIFAIIFFTAAANADDGMMDLDYQFIDNAFSNPNPSTNKQFEDVMKQYENKEPRGFFYNLRKFFNKNNPAFDKDFKQRYENTNNQPLRLKDEPQNKPTITIGANFYDTRGNVIQAGHYQADYKKDGEAYAIVLLQGNTRVADIKATPFEDDWETPAVVYARTVNIRQNLVRIIYSNLDITIQGYIRLE